MSSRSITGKLYKKGRPDSSKLWTIRDFSFNPTSRILQYSWKGEVKGAVMTDDLVQIKAINNSLEGKEFAMEIFCYKIESNGDISNGLRRFYKFLCIIATINID